MYHSYSQQITNNEIDHIDENRMKHIQYSIKDSEFNINQQETIGTLVNYVVAATFSINPYDLLSCGRGTAQVARARQVTAYLLHTGFSMKLTDIARFFSRDRTIP